MGKKKKGEKRSQTVTVGDRLNRRHRDRLRLNSRKREIILQSKDLQLPNGGRRIRRRERRKRGVKGKMKGGENTVQSVTYDTLSACSGKRGGWWWPPLRNSCCVLFDWSE